MTVPHVSIVVLNWNGYEDTRECVESVSDITYDEYQLLVVDNNSSGDDVQKLRDEFGTNDRVTIIENEENLGFAEGNNVGIRYGINQLDTDYVLLLNNDTTVEPGFLDILVRETESRDDVAVSGPVSLFYDDRETVQTAGIEDTHWRELIRKAPWVDVYRGDPVSELRDEPYTVDKVMGCAFMMNADCITELGGLDANFFIVHEESDWCERAQKKGYSCLVVPSSRIYHKLSQTTSTVSNLTMYYKARNITLYMYNHEPLPKALFLIFIIQLRYLVLKFGFTSQFKHLLMGIWDGLLGKPARLQP